MISEFLSSNILIPILIALFVGTPLSVYAGFIAGRILLFGEIKNQCIELINMNSGDFDSSLEINNALKDIEKLNVIATRLDKQNHKNASSEILRIKNEMESELSKMEGSFLYSEVRRKSDPKFTHIQSNLIIDWNFRIEKLKPSLRSILKPIPRI